MKKWFILCSLLAMLVTGALFSFDGHSVAGDDENDYPNPTPPPTSVTL